MKSIYLSPDGETMVIHDDEIPAFILLNKSGEQMTREDADAIREEQRPPQRSPEPNKKKVQHCKICGQPGTQSKTHPHGKTKDGGLPKREEPENSSVKRTRVPAGDVLACKAEGLDILRTAQKLNCTLSAVKEHWSSQEGLIDEDDE
jgi:hypothetical protein